MSAGIEVRFTRFDDPVIRRYLDEKARRALNVLGSVTMHEARRLIRRRKRPSKPGEPPSSPTGVLKRTIFYAYDPSTRSVVIGPLKTQAKSNVPQILEYGGYTERLRSWTPAEVGKHAPIRVARTPGELGGKKQWEVLVRRDGRRTHVYTARVLIRTENQARRANQILLDIFAPSAEQTQIRIAPRPYMSKAYSNIMMRAEAILKSTLGE